MIESDNLRTASLYINNQLLSRGLLRDGQNIDFADPESGAGLAATMGKVMSVVNDLILRRDKDAAQRESLSHTLLSLRADAQRHATEHTRLSERLAETQRKVDGAEAVERSLRQQLKSTESTIHKLKDEMAKTKILVSQSRAACANEVRKRDRQIDSLKKAVVDAGRVRGGNKNRDVVSISIVGDTGAEEKAEGVARGGTDDEGYSLRMETNEFLTELAKSLSEENSTLLELLRNTVRNLRVMSGLERSLQESAKSSGHHPVQVHPPPMPKNADELAAELEGIVEHLRTILTNPSFVPIEEVEIRETEIIRLRQGWERMEARWKDAVHMIDGWRRRMATSGKSVNMEELQMGLRLSPVRVRDVEEPAEEMHYQELSGIQEEEEGEEEEDSNIHASKSPSPAESLHLVPAPGFEIEEAGDESDSSSFQEDIDIEELEADEPNVQVLHESTATSFDSPPLPIPPQLSPLKDSKTSANRGLKDSNNGSYRKRPGDFTTIVEEKTWELAAVANEASQPPAQTTKLQSPRKGLKASPEIQEQLRPSSTNSYDSTLFGESYESPIRSNPARKLFSKASPPGSEPSSPRSHPRSQHEAQQASPRSHPRSHPEPPQQASPRSHPRSQPEAQQQASPRSHPRSQPRSHPAPAAKSSKGKQAKEIPASPEAPARPLSSKTTVKRTASAPDPATEKPARSPTKPTSKSTNNTEMRNRSRSPEKSDPTKTGTNTRDRSPVRPPPVSSRLPRRNNPAPEQSPITMSAIAAKLAASERDADQARVRTKLKAARMGRKQATPAATKASPQKPPVPDENTGDPVKRTVAPKSVDVKQEDELAPLSEEGEGEAVQAARRPPPPSAEKRRREMRSSKVVSRRRSTLSPQELESLIMGSVDIESPAR